ncbi:MAG: short-chain dehydrogenase, partial [Acidimicrobiia bacterium]
GEPVAAEIVERGGTGVCIETDVTVRASVEACVDRTVERFGGLEIMVHNAFSGGRPHRLEELDLTVWEECSRTAVWASLHCAQAAFPYLRTAGPRGRLILVTSPSGVEGSVNIPAYSAVKAAQRAMAKSLAREWGRFGITVNCMAPVAETPSLVAALARDPDLRQRIEARTALGRIGDPERDIGAVAVFLASDAAGYVTGQTIVCDGGSFTGL